MLTRLLILIVLALAPSAKAQPAQDLRPESAGRLTRFFGFEEPTPNPVPDFWVRARQSNGTEPADAHAGFPPINLAELDETIAASGSVSIRLPTRGGSTALMLSPGVVPVFSGADYRVSAKVRTKGLRHARAVLTARFLDAAANPIPATERRSEPVRSENAWTDAAVLVPGDDDRAAFLQIELQVLQPRELLKETPGKHHAMHQDYDGAAWFDDVSVIQLAKIDLVGSNATNVIIAPEVPVLRATIRDLTGESLQGRVIIRDLSGTIVESIEKVLGAGRAELTINPSITRYGWYRATFEVVSGGEAVGAARTDFVLLPPLHDGTLGMTGDRSRFGAALGPLPLGVNPDAAGDLLHRLGVGAASVPVWTRDLTKENVSERALALTALVDALTREYRELTFVLGEIPEGSADPTARADVWAVLGQDRTVYWPFLDQFLDRFGQRVRRWQIGEVGSDTIAWRKDLRADLLKFSNEVGPLISGPTFGVGSRVEFALDASSVSVQERPGAVASLVAADMPSWAAGEAVRAWRAVSGSSGELALVFERGSDAAYDPDEAVGDLVRKAVKAWIAASDAEARRGDASISLAVQQPWIWAGLKRDRPMPTPEYAAWRTLGDLLMDRVAIGEFPAAPGVRCVILAPSVGASAKRGGAMVLWNESADASEAFIDAYLGAGELTLVDHFGNRATLQKPRGIEVLAGETVVGARTEGGVAVDSRVGDGEKPVPTVRVGATRTPVFIEGIDVELVRLTASLRLTPDFLPATTQRKDLTIEFVNPWPTSIAGEITIVEPIGGGVSADGLDRSWKIVPRVMRFALKAGERASLPVSVAFGGLEEAGRRDFVLSMDLSGEQRVKGIRIRTPARIGLEHLKVDLFGSLTPTSSGPDASVEVQVTNVGDSPVDLELTAFAPKRPRASVTVSALAPGQQAVRRFVFPGAATALKGQKVLVSVTETEVGTRLNSSVVMP
jgi:hypothetical protein